MAVDHTHDEAEKALDARGLRQQSIATTLAEQGSTDPALAHKLEVERQAAYRYFLDTGNDFLDLSPAAQKAYVAAGITSTPLEGGVDELPVENTSLQDRMDHLGQAVLQEAEIAASTSFARGGTAIIRWGLRENDQDEDYTLGLSVGYDGEQPADVYLDITQQRLEEWRSLQGRDGEKRMAMGIVQHLVNLTGEDIAVAIASALGELVDGPQDDVHEDLPTETSVGDDDAADEATT